MNKRQRKKRRKKFNTPLLTYDNKRVLTYDNKGWGSGLNQCILWGRGDKSKGKTGPMFYFHDGVVECNLDRYIIMPSEKFAEMMGKKIEDINFV